MFPKQHKPTYLIKKRSLIIIWITLTFLLLGPYILEGSPGRDGFQLRIHRVNKKRLQQTFQPSNPICETDPPLLNDCQTFAFKPFFYGIYSSTPEYTETHFLYPLLKHKQSPEYELWNFLNLIQYKHSHDCFGGSCKKFDIVPLLSLRYHDNPHCFSGAIFPLGGKIYNYFGYDSIKWIGFPLYLNQTKGDISRTSLPWPFIRWQRGPNAGGQGFWPLAGHFWEKGKYDNTYFLWPLGYHNTDYLHDNTIQIKKGFLPLFALESAPNKQSTSIAWPLFKKISQTNPTYNEIQYLWPFIIQGKGEDKYINHWMPLYSHSINKGIEKKVFLWPLIQRKSWKEKSLLIDQQQLLYFLIWSQRQYRADSPDKLFAQKTHFWPLYSYWDNGEGRKQFQMFSPLEVFFPCNTIIREVYSPLFSVFRYNRESCGQIEQSLLFNIIKSEHGPKGEQFSIGPIFNFESRKGIARVEILKGLLGYQKINGKKSLRFLWLTL